MNLELRTAGLRLEAQRGAKGGYETTNSKLLRFGVTENGVFCPQFTKAKVKTV